MRCGASFFVIAVLLTACTTAAQRRAAEHTAVKKQAAQEIERICSLADAERRAALEKLKRESGYDLQCGEQ